MNFNDVLTKIKSFIQQWNRRILTPIGRITVFKTLILSKLNHLFLSLPTPKNEIIASLCKDIFEFIWKAKCDKVKRVVVTQDYYCWGLKMVKSLKCSWIKKLRTSNQPWKDIFLVTHGHDIVKKMLDFGDVYIQIFQYPKIIALK